MSYQNFYVQLNDNGKVTCFECGKMLRNTLEYKIHLKFVHLRNEIRVYACEFCDHSYADIINAVIHQLENHLSEEKEGFVDSNSS